jgi:hypothetical protein
MDSQDAFPTVQEWKTLLWQSFLVAAGIAAILVALSAFMQVIFLVGMLYGIVLLVLVFPLANYALRVEHGEPADPIDESFLAFPFSGAANYPQLLLLMVIALGTLVVSPAVAFVTGNATFSSGDVPGQPGPLANTSPSGTPLPRIPQLNPRANPRVNPRPNPPRHSRPNPAALPADFSPGNVRVVAVDSSSDWTRQYAPAAAFDSNMRTYWNTGKAPPGWIEMDLGKPTPLAELRLLLYTFPDSQGTHEVWISHQPIGNGQADAQKIHTFEGFFKKKEFLRYTFPEETMARYIQIRTTKSRSWPSWYEIAIDVK